MTIRINGDNVRAVNQRHTAITEAYQDLAADLIAEDDAVDEAYGAAAGVALRLLAIMAAQFGVTKIELVRAYDDLAKEMT